jgi:iron complex outermembrane receptor protein
MTKFLMLAGMILLSGRIAAQSVPHPSKDTTSLFKDSTKRYLKEVTVSSKYYRRYKTDKTSSSLKVNTPLLKLSQNIQEIDQSIIADQQAVTLNESVTRNVSGAYRNNNADLYTPYVYMRGAQITPLRNGMDISMIYAGPSAEDATIIGRVEFIKGPSSFINGLFDPAGTFNVVTKQPMGTRSNQIGFTAGSFNLYRLNADLDGNLDQAGKWQYRLNAVGQKDKSFQKYNFNDKIAVDPVVRYNINSHSSISAEYIFQTQRFQQYFATVFATAS